MGLQLAARALVILLLVGLVGSLAPGLVYAQVFSDGFESGDFSAWTTTSGTPTIITIPVHHGEYAAQFNANNEYAQKEYTQGAYSTVYLRFYFQVSALPSSGEECSLGSIELYSAGYSCIRVSLINPGAGVVWQAEYRDDGAYEYQTSDEVAVSTNTWYCVEMRGEESKAGNEIWQVWVDGVELDDLYREGDQGYDLRYVRVGTEILDYTANLSVDCVVVAVFLEKSGNLRVFSVGTIHTLGVEAYGGDLLLENGDNYIDWGTTLPGESANRSFLLRSASNVEGKLRLDVMNWNPTSISQYLNLTWDHEGVTIQPQEETEVTLTLAVPSSRSFVDYVLANNITEFGLDIRIEVV